MDAHSLPRLPHLVEDGPWVHVSPHWWPGAGPLVACRDHWPMLTLVPGRCRAQVAIVRCCWDNWRLCQDGDRTGARPPPLGRGPRAEHSSGWSLVSKAGNEPSRSLNFNNHRGHTNAFTLPYDLSEGDPISCPLTTYCGLTPV